MNVDVNGEGKLGARWVVVYSNICEKLVYQHMNWAGSNQSKETFSKRMREPAKVKMWKEIDQRAGERLENKMSDIKIFYNMKYNRQAFMSIGKHIIKYRTRELNLKFWVSSFSEFLGIGFVDTITSFSSLKTHRNRRKCVR